MSYYFAIIGTRDNPLFEIDFGTSKVSGDGLARFREEAKHMNQFIVHSALDLVEEAQWTTKDLYLKKIDSFQSNHIHTFLTGANVKFMLLMNPDPSISTYAAYPAHPPSRPPTARQSSLLASNPSSPQTEEAVRQFMLEIYEAWVKCCMNPFYAVNQPVYSFCETSPAERISFRIENYDSMDVRRSAALDESTCTRTAQSPWL